MATNKGSTSSWSRRGGRHGRSNGNGLKHAENSKVEKVEFLKGQHPKCLCDLNAIISISRTPENLGRLFFGCPLYKKKIPHCKFFAWVDQLFYINLDYDYLEDVAMDGCETAGHVSHMFAANIAGLEHKVMELQSRVDMLEIHQNVVPEIEWKTRYFNVVFVIIVCALLVLVMGVGIASL
ncbi:hypothetical protein Ahy_B08g094147 [Arachis hypogaea]|uniref:GRF-type domain-containing protein n=1 Tax=Arachis hypogaea TaxID=3818 RepID=A0A444Y803_ARAHY|nr:hypothetical protein Ahy_B08g094147 [Arachis hypogaea]